MEMNMKKLLVSLLCFWSGIMLASLPSDQTRTNAIDELRVKKNELDKNKPFNLFDLHLSQQEHEILESLQVKDSAPFDIYGNPEGKESDISLYLESLGNNPENSRVATAIIYRFIKESLTAYDAPAAWITIRSSNPNSHYDVARWHTDGTFFPSQNDSQAKIVTTLKGPGTLLSEVSDQIKNDYGLICQQAWKDLNFPHRMKDATAEQLRKYDHATRPKIIELIGSSPIQQAQARQGIIFLVGNPSTAAFHSEPAINTDRLFLSILPGTDEQIKFLHDVRKAGRPL